MPAKELRGSKRRGRLKQNHVRLQQLPNGQHIITLPTMWVELLKIAKGDALTFVPTENGIEVRPVNKSKKKTKR